MSFTPFARYRNFTLANLKSLLEVYPNMADSISWDFAKNLAEEQLKGYKRTAYQQACQLGLEDRSTNSFKVHNYLYTFDDNNLTRYLVFWFKTYYAPNPYVKSEDEAFLLYCRLCEDILQSENHSVGFEEFVEKNIGGKSDDILLNAIKAYASPVKYKKVGNDDVLYVSEADVTAVESEIAFIKTNFPIGESKSERDFFERFSYQNFCKFYDESVDPSVKDGEGLENVDDPRKELPFNQSKECARQLVDCIYDIDKFRRISSLLKNNDKNIKIVTDDLGGNYLRYMFAKSSSDLYENNTRVFIDKNYKILVDGNLEICRLSNQWVSSELIEGTTSGLFLKALISIINTNYSDAIKIYEEGGKWYLEFLMKKFKLEELPNYFDNDFAHRYISSLIAKPFVILTGNSGTGKTRIAKQISQYLEKDVDGKRNWLIVPVGADWTDNTKMLGFYNPLEERYVSTSTLDFILQASENPSIPHFLILDEMNLSHVERYFSDFLSAMESDEEIPLYKKPFHKEDGEECEDVIPEKVRLPKNLFVTGTVNIDETTYMFSPKVLDRSNVVEFNPKKDDVLALMTGTSDINEIKVAEFGVAEGFTALASEIRNGICNVDADVFDQVRLFLDAIYDELQESGFEFAYRTVKEIRQYFAAVCELQKEEFNLTRTMDEQIVQKILPKIYGDRKQIGELLNTLEEKCQSGLGEESEEMTLSLKKIEQMKKRLDKYQYASFM